MQLLIFFTSLYWEITVTNRHVLYILQRTFPFSLFQKWPGLVNDESGNLENFYSIVVDISLSESAAKQLSIQHVSTLVKKIVFKFSSRICSSNH